jgi:TIR domain
MRVFVSYRRSDVSGYSGRLTDALATRLGAGNVFRDVTTIAPGRNFETEIDRSLARSDAVLAMIGPGWLAASTPEGRQRLFEPDDFVRLELARALSTNVPIVPVLVGGARLPKAEELPEDLKSLGKRQAVALRDESFHQDVDRLLRSLRGEPIESPQARSRVHRRAITAVAATLAIIVAAGITWWVAQDPGTDQASRDEPTGCPDPVGTDWHPVALDGRPSATIPDDEGSLMFTVNSASWRVESAGVWQIVLTTQMQNNSVETHSHSYWYYRNLRVARRPFDVYCFDRYTGAAPGEIADARVGFNVTCPTRGSMSLVLEASSGSVKDLPFTAATTPVQCAPSNP